MSAGIHELFLHFNAKVAFNYQCGPGPGLHFPPQTTGTLHPTPNLPRRAAQKKSTDTNTDTDTNPPNNTKLEMLIQNVKCSRLFTSSQTLQVATSHQLLVCVLSPLRAPQVPAALAQELWSEQGQETLLIDTSPESRLVCALAEVGQNSDKR